jgi:hypothetical protein
MNKTVCSSATANPPSPLDAFISEAFAAADIAVRCVICEEYTPMNSHDGRARGVFICDKCKAAIMHIRNTLENT